MSMNMPDELPRYVRASHETQENKDTRYDPGIVHRPRGGSVTSSEDFDQLLDHDEQKWANPPVIDMGSKVETHGLSKDQKKKNLNKRRKEKIRQNKSTVKLSATTANNPMRSETALDGESNEAHDRAEAKKIDRNRQLVSTNWRADQHKEDLAAGQANLQQGDGVPDWASKEFAEQTLEKGPVEGSVPRGSEPADKTYESSASKEGITAMGPGASSQAVTRSAESMKDMDLKNRTRKFSLDTGKKPKSIRKLEGTLPGSRSLKNPKLKPYDPESTPSVEARNLSDRRAFKDNKEQAAGSYKRPEEPLTGPERESEPERKPSMWQKLKDRFK